MMRLHEAVSDEYAHGVLKHKLIARQFGKPRGLIFSLAAMQEFEPDILVVQIRQEL
jgi:hypothetical protein